MNKHIVKYLLALATIAFVGGGCNVDDYNEEYLDGFNPDKEITDVQVLKYTMTDADYASVASNAANKAIAEAAGPDAVAALAAVGKPLPPRRTCPHSWLQVTIATSRTARLSPLPIRTSAARYPRPSPASLPPRPTSSRPPTTR